MLSQQVKRVLVTVIMVVFIARCVSIYTGTLKTRAHIIDMPYDAFFGGTGLIPVVDHLRELNPPRVLGQKHDQDRFLYERLGEMLYPIKYMCFDDTEVRSGDLVVLPRDKVLGFPHKCVLAVGELMVLRAL